MPLLDPTESAPDEGRFLVLELLESSPEILAVSLNWVEQKRRISFKIEASQCNASFAAFFDGHLALQKGDLLYLRDFSWDDSRFEIGICPQTIIVYHPDLLLSATDLARGVGGFPQRKFNANLRLPHLFEPVSGNSSALIGQLAHQIVQDVFAQIGPQAPSLQSHSPGEIQCETWGNPSVDLSVLLKAESIQKMIQRAFRGQLFKWIALNPLAQRDKKWYLELLQNISQEQINAKGFAQMGLIQVLRDLARFFERYRNYWNYSELKLMSSKLGLEGSGDLVLQDPQNPQSFDLLELKNSNVFPKQSYPSLEHRLQVEVYDAIQEASSGSRFEQSQVLYLKARGEGKIAYVHGSDSIRQLPRLLDWRNRIVGMELKLCSVDHVLSYLGQMRAENDLFEQSELYPSSAQFVRDFEIQWQRMGSLGRSYVAETVAFVMREHVVARIGGPYAAKGVPSFADLWRSSDQEKAEKQSALLDLRLWSIHREGSSFCIELLTQSQTPAAKFRPGDLVVLYRRQGQKGLLLKAEFVSDHCFAQDQQDLLGQGVQKITLRTSSLSPEMNLWLQEISGKRVSSPCDFAIEYDFLDYNYRQLIKGMGHFVTRLNLEQRAMWLGQRAPQDPKICPIQGLDAADQVDQIAQAALRSQDFLLIQGPPGCGKTRRILPAILSALLNSDRNEQILVTAFTHSAVSEICAALQSLKEHSPELDFVRLGRSDENGQSLEDQLRISPQEGGMNSLELDRKLQSTPLVVSTLGRVHHSILEQKKFSVLIVDEASQIQESQLMPLLAAIPKWIFIGDPKQLPPVIQQKITQNLAMELREIGFRQSMGDSVMERLWRLSVQRHRQGLWPQVYVQVEHQYRMHRDLARFISQRYYGDSLRVGLAEIQNRALDWGADLQGSSELEKALLNYRAVGIDVGEDHHNSREVLASVQILRFWIEKLKIDPSRIGVVIPFRAQINALRRELMRAMPELFLQQAEPIKMDTVERFQGGQADFILISMGLHRPSQFETLLSITQVQDGDGFVDRKFNVALSRAREQIAIVAQWSLLCSEDKAHFRYWWDDLDPQARIFWQAKIQ